MKGRTLTLCDSQSRIYIGSVFPRARTKNIAETKHGSCLFVISRRKKLVGLFYGEIGNVLPVLLAEKYITKLGQMQLSERCFSRYLVERISYTAGG